jgi:hypothetical protein
VILINEGRKVVDAPIDELTSGGTTLDEVFTREIARDSAAEVLEGTQGAET